MSSNQKAAIAMGVVLFGLGASIALAGLQSEYPGDLEFMLMTGGFFAVSGATPILMVVATRRRRKAGRTKKSAKVVFGTTANRPGMSRYEFSSQSSLPPICVCCGHPTKHTSTHRIANVNTAYQKYDSSRMHPASFLFFWHRLVMTALTAFFITRIQHLLSRKSASKGDVLFRIPHCRQCGTRNPIRAYHSDFHNKRMIIHAHPNFVNAANT